MKTPISVTPYIRNMFGKRMDLIDIDFILKPKKQIICDTCAKSTYRINKGWITLTSDSNTASYIISIKGFGIHHTFPKRKVVFIPEHRYDFCSLDCLLKKLR